MKTAKVLYTGHLRTECTHLRSGSEIITDAPVDNRGKGENYSPTDLCATSLASCALTIMGIKAQDSGWSIDGARAEVVKHMGTKPRRITTIEVDIHIPRTQNWSDHEKSILEKVALSCPVAQSLHPDIDQHIRFHWEDV